MTNVGHFAVFWLTGLLTGTLLGWMLARGPASEATAKQDEPREAPPDRGRTGRS
jgi:hypothetical protein